MVNDPGEPEFYRCPENYRNVLTDVLIVAAAVGAVMLLGVCIAGVIQGE